MQIFLMVISRARIIFSLAIMVMLGYAQISSAEAENIAEHFKGFDANSTLTIDYNDISQLLNVAVFNTGRSLRQKANKPRASIGTRMKTKRKIHTALEANRFHFMDVKKSEYAKSLLTIRQSLELIPEEVSLTKFNRREQLAYWLNLYNITLIKELVDVAPKRSLGDYLYDDDGILSQKLLTVSGHKLSLNDIQFKIVYPIFEFRPALMYGFFQGVIGGPNIRTKAYTASEVNQQLDSNAEEFINSNRGTFDGRKGKLLISNLYKRNEQLFPNFHADVRKHLLDYVIGDFENKIKDADLFKPSIKDMHVANLNAGSRTFGASGATNSAAMIDSVSSVGVALGGTHNVGLVSTLMQDMAPSQGIQSADTIKMLIKLKANGRIRNGSVEVEESEVKGQPKNQSVEPENN